MSTGGWELLEWSPCTFIRFIFLLRPRAAAAAADRGHRAGPEGVGAEDDGALEGLPRLLVVVGGALV